MGTSTRDQEVADWECLGHKSCFEIRMGEEAKQDKVLKTRFGFKMGDLN